MKKRIQILGLALLALCALGGGASAAAQAAGHFYDGGKLIEKGSANMIFVEGTQTGSATLKTTIAGVATTITCTGSSSTATIENNATTNDGVLSDGTVTFTGCTVSATGVTGCLVRSGEVGATNGTIKLRELKGTTEGVGVLKLEAVTAPFVTLVLSGCSNTGLNITADVTGSAKAVEDASTHNVTFTATSGSSLKLGVNTATFLATFTFYTDGKGHTAENVISVGE